MRLTAINVFPVKSCRGLPLERATIEPWGLAGDRRWMLVDDAGTQLTAREHPRLLLVDVAPCPDGGLQLASPDADPVTVPRPEGAPVPIRVWRSTLDATPAGDEAHAWFGKITGVPTRLVYLDDPTRRHPNPDFATADDYVSFADGYPLLLTTQRSLDEFNDRLLEDYGGDAERLPMIRFRPNVVVDGDDPWAEDGWRRVRIGDAVFRAVKGCDRCVMTTIDPVTAAKGKEPIATLARHRRWDGATWFGMNLVPDTPGASISVGDDVEVLERVPAPDGPPR